MTSLCSPLLSIFLLFLLIFKSSLYTRRTSVSLCAGFSVPSASEPCLVCITSHSDCNDLLTGFQTSPRRPPLSVPPPGRASPICVIMSPPLSGFSRPWDKQFLHGASKAISPASSPATVLPLPCCPRSPDSSYLVPRAQSTPGENLTDALCSSAPRTSRAGSARHRPPHSITRP